MAIIMLGVSFGLWSPSQAQVGGIGGMGGMGGMGGGGGSIGAIPGASFESATDPSSMRTASGFHIVPMITVGQRYDSNVFFAPKTPGLDRDDFVTTVSPQARVLFGGDLVSLNTRVGANGQFFAKNNGLNNVGANVGLVIDASKFLGQFWPGTRFTVSDYYVFTPEPMAFLTGSLDTEEVNPLIRGFQAHRVNTHSNSVSVSLAAPISQNFNLTARYLNSLTHFGEPEIPQEGALLNTTFQTYAVGLAKRISLQDTVSASFLGSKADSGSTQSFSGYGGFVAWDHIFNTRVTLRSTAGLQKINDNSGSGSSSIAPGGSLTVFWNETIRSWRLSYNVGITPSLQFLGRPILTHAINFTVTQRTSIENLSAFVGLNYGRGNELGGGGSSSSSEISYTSYSASGGMSYRITPKTYIALIYSYARFDNRFGSQTFELDRHLAQVFVTQAFY
ncbi:MAG: hypothetical protein AB7P24_03245 [Nitrospira sp.]